MLQHGCPGGKGVQWPKEWSELDSSCIAEGGHIPSKDSFLPGIWKQTSLSISCHLCLFEQNSSKNNLKMSTHRPPQDLFRSKAELGLVLWQAGKVELIQFKFMTPSRINGKHLYRKKTNFSLRKIFQDTKSWLPSKEQPISWCWWEESTRECI